MTTFEELKRELGNKKAELRKYEIKLKQRNEAFDKLLDEMSPEFETEYDIDLYGCLFDTTDGDLDSRYDEAVGKLRDVLGPTKKFIRTRAKLTVLVDKYIDLMDGHLPREIERIRKEVTDLESQIKEILNSRS